MLICSGDIREQTQKLSKIANKFGRYFGRHFSGVGIVQVVPILSLLPRETSTEKKSREDTPTKPEVIASNRLNIRPDF